MVFWSIVLGVVALMLLFGWRVDRRNARAGGVRKGKIYDQVRIQQSDAQLKEGETGRRRPYKI